MPIDSPKFLPSGFSINKLKSTSSFSMKQFHEHPYYEILHSTSGTRIVTTEENTYLLSNLGVAFFKPNTKHSTSIEKRMYHERYILNVSAYILNEFLVFFNIDLDALFSCNVKLFTQDQINTIEQLFDKILIEYQTALSIEKNTNLRLYFAQLLIELTKGHPAPEHNHNSQCTYNIVLYIRQHFCENISLDTIANKFFTNKSQLCRILKNSLGKTFSEFLNELRIDYAKMLLKETNYTATHICTKCGYNNFSYFMRQFKKITGTTPTKYRNTGDVLDSV